MKHSEKYYLDLGGNRIVPESTLEVNVLRQAILADKWDLSPEQQSMRGTRWPWLCSLGGQAVFHPEWSPIYVVHYSVGDHVEDGFFDLKVSIYGQRLVASFLLRTALVFDAKPWFQTGWQGHDRSTWLCPMWFSKDKWANPIGLQLKVVEANGALMVGALSAEAAEWDCLPPHVLLVNPNSIKAE